MSVDGAFEPSQELGELGLPDSVESPVGPRLDADEVIDAEKVTDADEASDVEEATDVETGDNDSTEVRTDADAVDEAEPIRYEHAGREDIGGADACTEPDVEPEATDDKPVDADAEAQAAETDTEAADVEAADDSVDRESTATNGTSDADTPGHEAAETDTDAEPETAEGDVPAAAANGDETREDLHAFGNKSQPKEVRLDRDLQVDSPDAIVGPYEPTSPTDEVKGKSTFTDPNKAPLSGHYHVLSADAELPEGLGIHADGEDVGGHRPDGHRTIYPTVAMTAAAFGALVADLPWEYVDSKPKS
ncbi:hypothetical protein [Actinocrispum sp. NPDC049592]|uniref:hypothetical protein n=1 Tax=Actinocrispum sp. NPDC049592 TaxID=3154835 RepID=UPI00343468FD